MNRNSSDAGDSRKGSVSVLLMVLLSSMILVFILLYDSASFRTIRNGVKWNGDHAGNAVLTYYLPELKERYDLYGIWKEPSVLEWRMNYFVKNNSPFWNGEKGSTLLGAKCQEIHVKPENYLCMDPTLINQQIQAVMEQGFLVDLIQKTEWISQWKEILTWAGSGIQLQEEQNTVQVQRSGSSAEQKENRLLEEKKQELNREVTRRETQGEAAMNDIVLENGKKLTNPILIRALPSRQRTASKNGTSWEMLKQNADRLGEVIRTSFMTDLYALQYFGNYTNQQDGWFLCQVEYILQGELSDEENLNQTKRELFFLRTGLNLISISRSVEVKQFIGAMAAAAAPIPYPVAFGLLASAFAAAEAGEDVKILMNGGEVLALKNSGDWVSLSGELTAEDQGTENEIDTDLELSYENHLHLLLVLKPQETKILRMMDLIQLDLQNKLGERFTLEDLCVGFEWELRCLLKNSRGKERTWDCEGISRYGS